FLVCLGLASMSTNSGAPSFGIEWATLTPLPASSARSRACSTSPDQPITRQALPLARASMYWLEWKLRLWGRILASSAAPLRITSASAPLGASPTEFSAAGVAAGGAARHATTQRGSQAPAP